MYIECTSIQGAYLYIECTSIQGARLTVNTILANLANDYTPLKSESSRHAWSLQTLSFKGNQFARCTHTWNVLVQAEQGVVSVLIHEMYLYKKA